MGIIRPVRVISYGMNLFVIIFAVVAAIIVPSFQTQDAPALNDPAQVVANESNAAKSPVLVELFTSEGCSSCPPADRLLTTLDAEQPIDGVEVITLGFHVDYWDDGGWRDRFSSFDYTRRQQVYARHFGLNASYTPQAVVDGSVEAVGSNRSKVRDAIASRLTEPKAAISADIVGDKIRIDLSGIPSQRGSTVYIAAAESGLVSDVKRGENAGSQLAHVSVVRVVRPMGKIEAGQIDAKFEAPLPTNNGWKAANLRYVVIVQENESLRVIGVKRISRQ